MIKAQYVILLIILLSFKANAQSSNKRGKIVDKQTSLPVQNVNINVYQDKIVIHVTISDSIGNFSIPLSVLERATFIKISSISYENFIIDSKAISHYVANKNDNLGVFEIKKKSIELTEVKIKSKRRYRDTTKIDLSQEKFVRSIMIDDLFSKYGFTKDTNGQLYYKGKPVASVMVNGGDFFGKNDLGIYHLLPALILKDIKIIETNIDSVTNTTTLRPTITVNLTFKDQYKKGKFGNANLGIGSSNRDVVNANLFTYKNKEQISLNINTNDINLGDNTMQEPNVSFSANGNNLTTNSAKFTYRNIFYNKLKVSFNSKGELSERNFTSISERKETDVNILSDIFNSTSSRLFNIDDTKLDIEYKIDSLSTINVTQTFNHSHDKNRDSSNYNIKFDSLITSSLLNKIRNSTTDLLNTQVLYKKIYSSKKGRQLNIHIELDNNSYGVDENDNVSNASNQTLNKYFINGKRSVNENIYTINSDFTEPLGEDGYIKFLLSYEKDKLNYNTQTGSDTVFTTSDAPSVTTNQYFRPGIKFQKTFNKVSIDANLSEVLDIRNIAQLPGYGTTRFLNFNADLRADYKINDKKSLVISYIDVTNYPDVQLLTSLNSTFDLISQISGNIDLKPEQKKSVKMAYTIRPSDTEVIGINGEFSHFDQKFGQAVMSSGKIASGNIIENTSEENVGGSNGGQISFSILKSISNDKYFNFSTGVAYQESPTLINNKLTLNNGLTFNESLSTSIGIIKSLLSTSPVIGASYIKYFYGANSINITTLSYSDKLLLSLKAFQLELYPLINYNHSINNNASISMNGQIKKSVFKDYGTIWIQAYDIFNSFKYINNYIGSSSYQTVKYSNLNRYLLLGLSFKFNNMK